MFKETMERNTVKFINRIIKNFTDLSIDDKDCYVQEVMDIATREKKRINEFFGIDEKLGYKRVRTKINKDDVHNEFLRECVFTEIYLNEILERKFKAYVEVYSYKAKGKQIEVHFYRADSRNKHLGKVMKEYIPLADFIDYMYTSDKNTMMYKYFVDVNDIGLSCFHKIWAECLEEFNIYIVTNNFSMVMASESDYFSSCQSIGNDNERHLGNWQNLTSPDVFMVVRLDKEGRLMARAWCYLFFDKNDFPTIIIGRIYNATKMTGLHIAKAFEVALENSCFSDIAKYIDIGNYYVRTSYRDYLGYSDCDNGRKYIKISYDNAEHYFRYRAGDVFCLECGEDIYEERSVPFCKNCFGDRDKVSECYNCGCNIYDEDDYYYTSEGYYYCSGCGSASVWFCDTCNEYHSENIDMFRYYLRNGEDRVTCDENRFYTCKECNKNYEVEIMYETTDNDFVCSNCVENKDYACCDGCYLYTNEYTEIIEDCGMYKQPYYYCPDCYSKENEEEEII